MPETPLSHGTMPESDFASQFRRVFEAAECATQAELAEFFGIRQSSVADAKRRDSIPAGWLIKLFEKKRINPEWIRMGLGGKRLQAADAAEDIAPFRTMIERRPPEDCSTDELMAEVVRRALKGIG